MPSYFVGPIEDVVKVLCPVLIASYLRLMSNPQVSANFGRALVVPEEDNLHVWAQQCPGSEGIALDHIAVALEGLGSRKEGQHYCFIPPQALTALIEDKRQLTILS
jgi:hypothetical protein